MTTYTNRQTVTKRRDTTWKEPACFLFDLYCNGNFVIVAMKMFHSQRRRFWSKKWCHSFPDFFSVCVGGSWKYQLQQAPFRFVSDLNCGYGNSLAFHIQCDLQVCSLLWKKIVSARWKGETVTSREGILCGTQSLCLLLWVSNAVSVAGSGKQRAQDSCPTEVFSSQQIQAVQELFGPQLTTNMAVPESLCLIDA